MTEDRANPISEAIEVSKSFSSRPGLRAGSGKQQFVQALDRVSLCIDKGETVGLVGESGCGKSTLGRMLIRLETPTEGKILLDGEDITRLKGGRLRRRRRKMQMIFQDPASSLNPRFTVMDTLLEAIRIHKKRKSAQNVNAHIAALLDMVGLPFSCLHRLPGEFSGGERQRISIARSLAVEPDFLVADEPISSLDLSSQDQILNLLIRLQEDLKMAFLLIAHDMETVQRLCRRVAVMYLGRILETAPRESFFKTPRHPYTKALLAAQLSSDPDNRQAIKVLPGDAPSPLEPPSGCHFHPRCPYAQVQCRLLLPDYRQVGPQHFVRCHFDFEGEKPVTPRLYSETASV